MKWKKNSYGDDVPDLATILTNGDDLPEQYRLDEVTCKNIRLYLKAFHLTPDERVYYLRGKEVIEEILESGTYFGFVLGLKGKGLGEPFGKRAMTDVWIGYTMGWELGTQLAECIPLSRLGK